MVKQAFVCGQLVGTHTPLLVGDNEEAVSGAAAVGLKGNTDGKKGRGEEIAGWKLIGRILWSLGALQQGWESGGESFDLAASSLSLPCAGF